MKVSIIIPTYNRCTLLWRAVESALQQTYPAHEIIVVDDGSNDDTESHFSKVDLPSLIHYVRLRENSGVHVARNKGIEEAQGDFIIFLDSDDEILPDAVGVAIARVNKDPEIDFLSGSFRTDTGIRTGFHFSSGQYLTPHDLLCGRAERSSNKGGFVMVRASIAKECRFLAPNMDFIFYRYVARKCRKIFYVSQICGIYHTETGGVTMTKVRKVPNISRSIVRAQALEQFVIDFREEIEAGCPHILTYYTYGATAGLLLGGEYRRARVMARISLKHRRTLFYLLMWLSTYVPFSHYILRAMYSVKKWWALGWWRQ